MQSQLYFLDKLQGVVLYIFPTDDLCVLFCVYLLRNLHVLYMSTAPAGSKRNFTVRYRDLLILSIKVRRKAQFFHNVEAHRRCVEQTLGTQFNFFFSESYVLRPSAAETQADIFTVGVYFYKTHFIKILIWVLLR